MGCWASGCLRTRFCEPGIIRPTRRASANQAITNHAVSTYPLPLAPSSDRPRSCRRPLHRPGIPRSRQGNTSLFANRNGVRDRRGAEDVALQRVDRLRRGRSALTRRGSTRNLCMVWDGILALFPRSVSMAKGIVNQRFGSCDQKFFSPHTLVRTCSFDEIKHLPSRLLAAGAA